MRRSSRLFKIMQFLTETLEKSKWKPTNTSLGIDAIYCSTPSVEQHVMFNIIKKVSDGVFLQPCFGVRFLSISEMRTRLWESNKATGVLDYFDFARRLDKQREHDPYRWFIASNESEFVLRTRCEAVVADVLQIAQQSNIFEELRSEKDFVLQIERTVPHTLRTSCSYILALVILGRFDEASELSSAEIGRLGTFASENKNNADEQMTDFYRSIIRYCAEQ